MNQKNVCAEGKGVCSIEQKHDQDSGWEKVHVILFS